MSSQPACVLYRYYVTAADTGDDYDNHIHSGVASSCIGVSDYRPLSAFKPRESMTFLKLVADTHAAATTNPSPNANPTTAAWRSG